MGHPADENLPEVVPDQSPQVLSSQEAHFRHGQFDVQSPKYPVYVEDSPKFSAVDPQPGMISSHPSEAAVSPEDLVPWESRSAGIGIGLFAGDQGAAPDEKNRQRTICGLRRRLFWLFFAAVLIIVVASVGGGVGGGIAAAKAREGGSDG